MSPRQLGKRKSSAEETEETSQAAGAVSKQRKLSVPTKKAEIHRVPIKKAEVQTQIYQGQVQKPSQTARSEQSGSGKSGQSGSGKTAASILAAVKKTKPKEGGSPEM